MKIPFSFGVRIIYRLFIPGLVLAVGTLPVAYWVFHLLSNKLEVMIYLPLAAIIMGWLVMLLDMPIYMIFEGRRFWPPLIRKWALAREERRLKALTRRMDDAHKQGERSHYLEASVETTRFPLGAGGNREAQYPTRLGNIIAEYEGYPKAKYAMDGVFYWYRIWVGLPKDTRDEVDEQQALVDSAIYMSFALAIVSLALFVYMTIEILVPVKLLPSFPLWGKVAAATSVALCSYIIYRLSLMAHAQYGNFFKALFDRYHTTIENEPILEIIAEMTGDERLRSLKEREANMAMWRFLQWHTVRLPGEVENRNIAVAKPAHELESNEEVQQQEQKIRG